MKTALTLLAVLCIASVANAGISVQFDPAGVAVGVGLKAYTVRLVADSAADMATAWDGAFTGPLNQYKAFGTLAIPTLTEVTLYAGDPGMAANSGKDSHFQFEVGVLTIPAGNSPREVGTNLLGAFAWPTTMYAMDIPLALIVLADGAEAQMTGNAANATGDKFATIATIPEPATLALLGLGALALRRRK